MPQVFKLELVKNIEAFCFEERKMTQASAVALQAMARQGKPELP